MLVLLQFLALMGATLFAGAALYVSLVEHPARLECGVALAATVFGPSYRRAARMQLSLALLATAGGLGAWLAGGGVWWLPGALAIFAVVPFTYLCIMPINGQLLDPALDRSTASTRALLDRWGRLHAVRSGLGLLASILYGVAALGR